MSKSISPTSATATSPAASVSVTTGPVMYDDTSIPHLDTNASQSTSQSQYKSSTQSSGHGQLRSQVSGKRSASTSIKTISSTAASSLPATTNHDATPTLTSVATLPMPSAIPTTVAMVAPPEPHGSQDDPMDDTTHPASSISRVSTYGQGGMFTVPTPMSSTTSGPLPNSTNSLTIVPVSVSSPSMPAVSPPHPNPPSFQQSVRQPHQHHPSYHPHPNQSQQLYMLQPQHSRQSTHHHYPSRNSTQNVASILPSSTTTAIAVSGTPSMFQAQVANPTHVHYAHSAHPYPHPNPNHNPRYSAHGHHSLVSPSATESTWYHRSSASHPNAEPKPDVTYVSTTPQYIMQLVAPGTVYSSHGTHYAVPQPTLGYAPQPYSQPHSLMHVMHSVPAPSQQPQSTSPSHPSQPQHYPRGSTSSVGTSVADTAVPNSKSKSASSSSANPATTTAITPTASLAPLPVLAPTTTTTTTTATTTSDAMHRSPHASTFLPVTAVSSERSAVRRLTTTKGMGSHTASSPQSQLAFVPRSSRAAYVQRGRQARSRAGAIPNSHSHRDTTIAAADSHIADPEPYNSDTDSHDAPQSNLERGRQTADTSQDITPDSDLLGSSSDIACSEEHPPSNAQSDVLDRANSASLQPEPTHSTSIKPGECADDTDKPRITRHHSYALATSSVNNTRVMAGSPQEDHVAEAIDSGNLAEDASETQVHSDPQAHSDSQATPYSHDVNASQTNPPRQISDSRAFATSHPQHSSSSSLQQQHQSLQSTHPNYSHSHFSTPILANSISHIPSFAHTSSQYQMHTSPLQLQHSNLTETQVPVQLLVQEQIGQHPFVSIPSVAAPPTGYPQFGGIPPRPQIIPAANPTTLPLAFGAHPHPVCVNEPLQVPVSVPVSVPQYSQALTFTSQAQPVSYVYPGQLVAPPPHTLYYIQPQESSYSMYPQRHPSYHRHGRGAHQSDAAQTHEYVPIPGRLISQATARRHNTANVTTASQITPPTSTAHASDRELKSSQSSHKPSL